MGASREGFDIFNKCGRRAIWRNLKKGWPLTYFWIDSFGRFACFILGHDKYECDPGEFACRRCHHYLLKGKK